MVFIRLIYSGVSMIHAETKCIISLRLLDYKY